MQAAGQGKPHTTLSLQGDKIRTASLGRRPSFTALLYPAAFKQASPALRREKQSILASDKEFGHNMLSSLYFLKELLFQSFNGRLTDSGQIVTEQIVPFTFIRGGWVQDSQGGWARLIVQNKLCVPLFAPCTPPSGTSEKRLQAKSADGQR